jgi:hypothetical protein
VLLHPVGGLLILGLLFVMFQAVFTWADAPDGPDRGRLRALGGGVGGCCPRACCSSLLTDGLIAGVGSVLVFLPQIVILFFFILLLEDSGYMTRAAFLMDKIMGGAGLHGRAFIPLLSSFACAIPGIMATRVIDNKHDRLTTILVAPLMTCSARIPVYTLIIGAFIPHTTVWGFLSLQGLVMFGLYASGIVSALLVSFVIRRVFWRGTVEPFMMELPTYRWPEPRKRADEPVDPRADLHERAGADHPAADGAGLGAVDLPLSARGRDRSGHRLQLRRPHRPLHRARHGPDRLQLADDRGPDPRLRRARSRRGRPGHRLRRGRRRRSAATAILSTTLAASGRWRRPCLPGLVRLRPAVRGDAGRGQARDQQLETVAVADGDVPVHDRPGLSGLVRDLPRRRGDGGGLSLYEIESESARETCCASGFEWLARAFGAGRPASRSVSRRLGTGVQTVW